MSRQKRVCAVCVCCCVAVAAPKGAPATVEESKAARLAAQAAAAAAEAQAAEAIAQQETKAAAAAAEAIAAAAAALTATQVVTAPTATQLSKAAADAAAKGVPLFSWPPEGVNVGSTARVYYNRGAGPLSGNGALQIKGGFNKWEEIVVHDMKRWVILVMGQGDGGCSGGNACCCTDKMTMGQCWWMCMHHACRTAPPNG